GFRRAHASEPQRPGQRARAGSRRGSHRRPPRHARAEAAQPAAKTAGSLALSTLAQPTHARMSLPPLAAAGSSTHFAAAAWIPLWLAAALLAIFQTGFMPLYSTRTLGVAWEMWNSGQFLVPHANGVPYSHKVPLLFWLIHAGWAVGGVGDVWPRLLEVLIGLGVLLQAQRLARVLFRDAPLVAQLTPW